MRSIISKFLVAIQVAGFFGTTTATVDPIVIEGSHFFYKTNGSEFFIRGVAYQQGLSAAENDSTGTAFIDPLADSTTCLRDIPYLQALKTNVIHVYAIDSTQDHSTCMALLDAAGIYVLVDLTTPSLAIDRDNPTWNVELYAAYTAVVDSMQSYTNVLGFFAGNEVTNNVSNSASAAYVKAAVRDMKSYMTAKGYRSIGVGYASNDDATTPSVQDYFNCGDNSSSIDFLGLNIYSWCGDSSYTESGYSVMTDLLSNYSIPVFLSEYGCNTVQPRTFSEVEAIYGSQMTNVFSGGIVYEYFEEANDYGLVSISGNAVSTLKDYGALSAQMASASPSSTASSAYKVTNTVTRGCPTTGSTWLASETLPPTPNSELCNCMLSSLSCVAESEVNTTNAGTLFSQGCSVDTTACSGIASNASTGVYGAYSVCNVTAQVSWAMNQYYLSNNNASSSCDFSGLGKIQSPVTNTNTQCQALLAQAGAAGTGTVSLSTEANTGTSTSSGRSSATGILRSSPGSGNSSGNGASSGGLSTGSKVGISIAVVLIVAIIAAITLCLWRRKRKVEVSPLAGDGGLEVGDAPPQFTALGRAEMAANEIELKKDNVITGEPIAAPLTTHDIRIDVDGSNGLNELDSDRERQELDSTRAPLQSRALEIDSTARQSELSDISSVSLRVELSGNSTSRSELSPRRKPIPGSASPRMSDQQPQMTNSESWSNNPWSDLGLGVASPVTSQSAAEAAAAETAAAEMMRLEEEERRIDEAIAESERLQALRKEKEELQKRKLEVSARAKGGGGRSTALP